ncbi:MAG: Maf family protein [Clostridiales Family XIII bacterium]|jgi:septum formation protein|nr:Maf family protein [Clostridiales Family XIII bacterium]
MTDTARTLILASASPRRKEILEAHGHRPLVLPSDADESIPGGMDLSPEETAMFLAAQKALAVAKSLPAHAPEAAAEGALVIGVDTIVYRDHIIGKPKDEADALAILRSLKNGTHSVISGVCLISAGPAEKAGSGTVIQKTTIFYDTTLVTFDDYTDTDILAYVRANPPYDKSGSYAIQSDWGRHAVRIDGSTYNIIGFPYERIEPYLR